MFCKSEYDGFSEFEFIKIFILGGLDILHRG
jgi:hypothetical protein